MTLSLLLAVAFLLFGTSGCENCLVPDGPPADSGQTADSEEATESSRCLLQSYLPARYEVGQEVLGLRILAVQGNMIELENPFVYRQAEMLTPDGFSAGALCNGVSPANHPLVFDRGTGILIGIARSLQDAFFTAALEARTGWEVGPYVGYCSAENPDLLSGPRWYQTAAEIAQLEAIYDTYCDPSLPGYEGCEAANCEAAAAIERIWTDRPEQRRLNDDFMHKYNIGMYLLYSKIIETCQDPVDAPIIQFYQSHMLAAYRTLSGSDPSITAQRMGQVERDLQICLAGIGPGHGNPNPDWPDCSFDFGLGPVGISIAPDGSITLSGGAGLIVSITHNPKTKVTTVALAAGIEGHLGPYSITAETGAILDLQGGIQSFSDVSLGIGFLKCSFDQ